MKQYAPGMRLVIRDEEWLVKKVDLNSFGSYTLTVVGLSRLVKDRQAIFITSLEDDIITIKPEETKLVIDNSSNFIKSRLYIESLLRRQAPTDNKLYIGNKAAMNTLEYQLDPAIKALDKPRQRILISDEVGLGKTLEAGILMSELILRGKGKRILVVTVKSMMTQFQKEMWNRFTIPLVKLDSHGIQKIRNKIPSNHNPFNYYDKTIISIDTLKRDSEYRNYLENSWWDIIVIDEAHNVAERGKHLAQRARLAKLLSEKSDTLIMLSATPHDGKPESFASLMNMLDPTAIANPKEYEKDDIKDLFVRRFKKDIQHQVEGNFKERKIFKEQCEASSKEDEIYDYFSQIEFKTIGNRKNSGDLFKTTLEKSLFSSPRACIMTLTKRINKLSKETLTKDVEHDLNCLLTLRNMLESLEPQEFSRYKRLIEILKSKEYGWSVKDSKDRVVIFTERIETLKFLKENLLRDLKLKEANIAVMYGDMGDVELQKVVDDFGREESKLRILIASDVASEGINLHYLSHRLIHFDIPWSLMVFQQRNGRIDRYGQEEVPDIRYLMTLSDNAKIKGDVRILEILIDKEDQAVKNIGDPSVLMNVYDSEEEEKITASAFDNNLTADEFEKNAFSSEMNFMESFLMAMDEAAASNNIDQATSYSEKIGERLSIFSDFDYLSEALDCFNIDERYNYEKFDQRQQINLKLTSQLKSRLKDSIPEEVIKDDILRLSPNSDFIQEEIKSSRQAKMEEEAWPKVQYLWALNPIIEWVNDKASTLFARQEAPIVGVTEDLNGEIIYIVSGLIPNRKSHPLVNEWFGVCVKNDMVAEVISMEEVMKKVSFKDKIYPNTNRIDDSYSKNYENKLSIVVDRAKEYMNVKLKEFEDIIDPKLDEELEALEKLRGKHHEQLSLFYNENENSAVSKRKKEEKERNIDETFDKFLSWIEDTMTLEKNPYIQIIAVIAEVE